jgi:hypothetical protein
MAEKNLYAMFNHDSLTFEDMNKAALVKMAKENSRLYMLQAERQAEQEMKERNAEQEMEL